jgi:hypothetical protein
MATTESVQRLRPSAPPRETRLAGDETKLSLHLEDFPELDPD